MTTIRSQVVSAEVGDIPTSETPSHLKNLSATGHATCCLDSERGVSRDDKMSMRKRCSVKREPARTENIPLDENTP
ncbi:unnamed protein product [Nippostrongylus brasiliensis]|nr:unnamed protein product [Nippostrongylus brasiliensis]